MKILDRTAPPEFRTIDQIEMTRANKHVLPNKVELYEINAGTQDVIKVELLFEAGSRLQKEPLLAYSVSSLIPEGTSKLSSQEVSEAIDYYGAFLQADVERDYATITLFTLNKYLKDVLPVFKEVVCDAFFHEDEIETFVQNEKQKYLVDTQKVSILARKYFNEMLFGSSHPYGYNTKYEDYDKLNRNSIKAFFDKYYNSGNCRIIVAGKVADKERKLISESFGKAWGVNEKVASGSVITSNVKEKQRLIEKDDAIQSAIRIGRIMFNKTHEDYFGMQVLSTVLGGYFGSRLMANIREDKGYTYGIGTGLISLKESGCFVISTEVGIDVCDKAIKEIYFEIRRLRDDLISEDELELVRNYMMGVFLKNVDGAFALSDRLKSLLEYHLDYTYYDNYIKKIKTISSAELRELANKYLQQDDLLELVIGKR